MDYEGNPQIYRWNYFYTPVQIGDDVVGVRIAVRDRIRSSEPVTTDAHWPMTLCRLLPMED